MTWQLAAVVSKMSCKDEDGCFHTELHPQDDVGLAIDLRQSCWEGYARLLRPARSFSMEKMFAHRITDDDSEF
jgi:hypothetical protein